MAVDLKPAPDTSLTELVSGILTNARDLMTQQFELLRHEVLDDVRKTRDAGILLGVGAAFGVVAGILLMMMLVHLVHWAIPDLPLWGSFGIWGAIAFIASLALLHAGKQKISTLNPVPEQSVQALKENVQWITHPK